ncbi:winged helix-turn-helix domain-containing protein [Saccharothrix coeruleofusca]|uniref:HTH cro/C1-type domain-containing protein n=1 Tax=Saccharothrix coeruleofusca TaxID=33919 RepID=A0A918EDI7_9PSEU|nr:winged helix-turn-helix domain-containing protein [Saccharothrix coeruleofusca]MBP2334091.1 transposase [Saccharothrix coeruleofusca]MBP2334705.1 transposase [Saccharothrix coeruleofusca]MBP2335301.1 transposase [Saccharothrix coeruleofusca]MBP2338629.1 transposase [Saccharothrix coeruleofusca]MBP2340573.1 transposase [Saccharothrix coeruleofusca]
MRLGGGLTGPERQEREQVRLRAADLFDQGMSQADIARLLGVSPQAVSQWRKHFTEHGVDGLLSAGPSGARCYLDDEQIRTVLRELDKGPAAHGWADQRWTLARIGRVITETTGVVYAAPDGIWRLLRRIGWSWQMPRTRALERNEEVITAWRTEVWPRVKHPRARQRGSASRTKRAPR